MAETIRREMRTAIERTCWKGFVHTCVDMTPTTPFGMHCEASTPLHSHSIHRNHMRSVSTLLNRERFLFLRTTRTLAHR